MECGNTKKSIDNNLEHFLVPFRPKEDFLYKTLNIWIFDLLLFKEQVTLQEDGLFCKIKEKVCYTKIYLTCVDGVTLKGL